MILLLLGCGPALEQSTWTPEDWIDPYTLQSPSLYDELQQPQQMVLQEDSIWIIDENLGQLISIDLEGNAEVIDDYLGSPTILTANDLTAIIYDSENGQLLKSSQGSHTVFSNPTESISDLLMIENEVFWINDEGTLFRQGINETTPSTVLEYLNNPTSLLYENNTLWIACSGDNSIWSYTPSLSFAEEVVVLDDEPRKMAWSEGKLWVTTRSSRWPYAGWIVSVEGSQAVKVVNSPPEPEHIIAYQDTIYWSSKQSITKYIPDSTTYEMVISNTAVSDMHIEDGTLYWLDIQQAALLIH
jgi:hypothetical protein